MELPIIKGYEEMAGASAKAIGLETPKPALRLALDSIAPREECEVESGGKPFKCVLEC